MHKLIKRISTLSVVLGAMLLAAAQESSSTKSADLGLITKTLKVLTMRAQLEAAQTAIDTCAASNVHVHVWMVDANGNTTLFLLGDGTRYNTVETARQKAFTSAIMGQPTAAIQKRIAENPGTRVPPDPRLIFVGGGVPIRAGSEVIAAIGVGGGTPEQDDQCAQAGVEKIQHYLK